RYCREHAAEFEEPPPARASPGLVRVPEAGGSEGEDKARTKVADVIRRAKAGGDFAKLAKDNSEDPGSASNGGDLGWVRRGEMVPQFEQALFAVKKGEISPEPVRTSFGFHAIKVLDVREAGKKPLKDVAAQIRARLEAEAAEKVMTARAEEIRPKLLAAKDFTGQAKELGLAASESSVARTGRFAAGGGPNSLEEAAFNLTPRGVPPPVKTAAGPLLRKAADADPAGGAAPPE